MELQFFEFQLAQMDDAVIQNLFHADKRGEERIVLVESRDNETNVLQKRAESDQFFDKRGTNRFAAEVKFLETRRRTADELEDIAEVDRRNRSVFRVGTPIVGLDFQRGQGRPGGGSFLRLRYRFV